MRTTTRSTMSSGGEGGGGSPAADDDDSATRSPILRRSSSSRWLLVGCAALLLLQLAAAAPSVPTENPNARAAIDIPSSVETLPIVDDAPSQDDTALETPQHHSLHHDHHHSHRRGGYDVDVKEHNNGMLLKRSDKTMKDYQKFIDNNCRDIDNYSTFLTWEQQQFTQELKANILAPLPAGSTRAKETRAKLRAKLEPSKGDPTEELKSLCKMNMHSLMFDDKKIMEKTNNDHLENEIVNAVFSFMYRAGKKNPNEDKYVIVPRKRKNNLTTVAEPPTKRPDEDGSVPDAAYEVLRSS